MMIKAVIKRKLAGILGISEINERLELLISRDLARASELRAFHSSAELVEEKMFSAKPLDSKTAVLDYALSLIPKGQHGMYCEFGVFRGETINHIAKQVTTTIYGFDSFKGLPEDWKCFSKGHFSLRDGELPRCEKNVELIPGWFDVTLPAFAHDHPEPVLFLHVDCDLYSSTKTILFHLGERLGPGSVIVFDEYFNYPGWKKHEHLAFQEYVTSSGRCFEYVCYNRFSEQVAVKIL